MGSLTKASLVYQSPWAYDLTMWVLYGRHYSERYRAVAGLIPDGVRVLDVCCGPGFLYERSLRMRRIDYTGIDLNPSFALRVERLGGRGLVRDLSRDEPLPTADYVIIQAALYQFLPDAARIVRRLIEAATAYVVVAEPVRNLATSGIPVFASLARRATDAGLGACPLRFTERSLDALLEKAPARLDRAFLIPGGREKVYLLDKSRTPAPPEPGATQDEA
jgi:SAM-dependent methyltransferase